MNYFLLKLSDLIKNYDQQAYIDIINLAGRYDKVPFAGQPTSQHAFKYIMYLKLMHGLDDASFHSMKRKYLDTGLHIQEECRNELNKLISADAIKTGISSAEITKRFYDLLSKSKTII
jgi:hypothetical protein